MPVKIFFCYAHEDEPLLNKLKAHLSPLQRQGLIEVWHDRDISAGTEWEQEISKQLNEANIILLLVSPDFMNSDYCYGVEMKRALERHKSETDCVVIPVILRPCYWQGEPLGKLQAIPMDAKPVTSWSDQDEAFFTVAEGIRKVIKNPPFQYSEPEGVSTPVLSPAPVAPSFDSKKLVLAVLVVGILLGGSVVISFFVSTLVHTPTPSPTATTTATGTGGASPSSTALTVIPVPSVSTSYLPKNAVLVVNDPLKQNMHTWTNFASSPYCQFIAGAYHVKVAQNSECDYKKVSFSNFVFQIQMRFVTDTTCGEIIFRKQTAQYTPLVSYYYFSVCTNGSYSLNAVSNNLLLGAPLLEDVDQVIHQGVGQTNLVAVVANGNNLDFYINGTKIDHVNDNTSSAGTIGVSVSNLGGANGEGEVAFNDAKVWTF